MEFLNRMRFFFAALALILLFSPPASAGGLRLHENAIKAGLLYNFLKYTTWPDADASMKVCVFGDDPFDGMLAPMDGRMVNGKTISVRFIRAPSEAAACRLLFVYDGERSRWPELRDSLAGKSVLTVSDFAPFAASGGTIEFTREDGHIGAVLNKEALQSANLRVQDNLLKLVTILDADQAGKGPE
jgi:hypothetical protein